MNYIEVLNLVGMAMAPFQHMQDKDPEPIAGAWLLTLGDLPVDLAKAALLKVLCTAKHFPVPAEIREAALSLTPSGIPTQEEAWGEVVNAVRNMGYTRTPRWSHPAIAKAVTSMWGSWERCCQTMPCGGGSVERSQFMRLYTALTEAERMARLIPDTVRGRIPGGEGGTTPLLPGDTK